MSTADRFPILVLDDDPVFREIVKEVLGTRGYEIVEARNTREASQHVASTRFSLALVDFRLPDMDGMTWISRLREGGSKIPVVFISGQWCDQKTFTWLRNILRVSLILQKPITPDLFVQQLEGLLPQAAVLAARQSLDLRHIEEKRPVLKDASASTAEQTLSLDEIDRLLSSEETSETLRAQLTRYLKQLKKKESLSRARENYSLLLPQQWKELTALVQAGMSKSGDAQALQEARELAHKIQGTAGTLGYQTAGEIARKVEEHLKGLETTSTTEQEIFKSEMMRVLAEGEQSIKGAITSGGEQKGPPKSPRRKLLIVTSDTDLLNSWKKEADETSELIIAQGAAGALLKTKADQFDAIVIDHDAVSGYGLSALSMEVRASLTGKTTALALFVREGRPTEGDLLLSGFDVIVELPLDQESFKNMVERLDEAAAAGKAKVLVVDDDPVLTAFVREILGNEGFSVETLNEPIQILETLQSFKPDLVLLDVIMPGLSGYDVARMIKTSDEFKNTTVLFLTSQSSPEGRAAAFKAGGDDFLSKPVLTAELIARVAAHIERKGTTNNTLRINEQTGCQTRESMARTADYCLSGREKAVSLVQIKIDGFDDICLNQGVLPATDMHTGLGRLLTMRFRAKDVRAHWGEDGYVLILPGIKREVAAQAVELLLEDFKTIGWMNMRGEEFLATFSASVVQSPEDGITLAELLQAAQSRMLMSRLDIRGKVVSGI